MRRLHCHFEGKLVSTASPDVRPTRPADSAAPEHSHLGLALAIISTAQLMVVLDATIVNIALPSIRRDLHFSVTGLEWVINAYALAFGGLLLLGGRVVICSAGGGCLWPA